MSAFAGPDSVERGMLLCVDAANIKSYPQTGSTLYDISGKNTNGTIIGTTFDSEKGGNFVFDGSSSKYISFGTNSNLKGLQLPLTIMGWAKLTSADNYATLYGAYASTSGGQLFSMIRINYGALGYYTSTSDGSYQQFSFSTNIELNVWKFYAIIVSGTVSSPSVRIYVNDQYEDFSCLPLSATPDQTVDIRIGGNQSGFSEGWIGKIAHLSVYNVALTDAEVKKAYNAIRVRFGLNLAFAIPIQLTSFTTLLYYDAGNTSSYPGSGTTVTDLSGNGYTGTLQNGTSYDSANGGSFSFDGVDDKISFAGPTLSDSYTIFMWIYPISSDTYGTLFGDNIGNGGLWLRGTGGATGRVDFYVNASGGSHMTYTALDLNAWNHFAVVVTPTTTKFYKNGVLDTNTYDSLSFTPQAMGDDSASETFNGKIALVKALTPSATVDDVLADFNANRTRFGI